MNRKTLIILISLSLLAGAGLAGGLYLVSTPTNIAPRAASSGPTISATGRSASGGNNQQSTITPTPTPTPSTPLTRDEIIASFGDKNPRADLNADGTVNSLDLSLYDQKNQ